jgi:hypothetical protein
LIDREDNFLEAVVWKLWVVPDILVKISVLADLGDDIAIVNAGVDIETFDNIGMIHHPQDIDLTFQQPTSYLAFYISDSHLFNCHLLISHHINSFKHLTKTPLS